MVLMGDSIMALWPGMGAPKEIAGLRVVNRGIPGDDTAGMVARFDRDVVRMRPEMVVLLGGVNDFVRVPLAVTERNLEQMAETAHRNGIRVLMAQLTPLGVYPGDSPEILRPDAHDKIRALNEWIRSLAERKDYVVVDFHSVLSDERGFYFNELTTDGVHPSIRGYQRMTPPLWQAIELARK